MVGQDGATWRAAAWSAIAWAPSSIASLTASCPGWLPQRESALEVGLPRPSRHLPCCGECAEQFGEALRDSSPEDLGSVRVLILAPDAGLGGLRLRGPLEQE